MNHYLDIAFPAIFAALRHRVPLLCSVGTPLHSPRPARDRILRLLDRLIVGNLVFPFCERIIGWDANILDYIHDVHGNRFSDREKIVVYGVNGDSREFLEHQHDYAIHNQILCVGAVIEQRDYVPMVRAFHSIASEFPEMTLKVVGHVYYDRALKLAETLGLGKRVHFVGEQPHEYVLEELKRSDLFFASLSGKYLGMGTATLESMLMGVPTLCNVTEDHLGGPVLKDLEHIVFTRGLEHEFIAARLRQLLAADDLRRRVGVGGRAFVTEHMNWEKVAQDMEHVIENLLRVK